MGYFCYICALFTKKNNAKVVKVFTFTIKIVKFFTLNFML